MSKKSALPVLLTIVLVAMALPSIINIVRGPAPTPDVFSDAYTLEQARALSAESGKPIFALATADWCGPCQALKRGPLQDPEVTAMIRDHAIPVYLEHGENAAEMRELGPSAVPTSYIIEGGRVVASLSGGEGYANFLRQELLPVE